MPVQVLPWARGLWICRVGCDHQSQKHAQPRDLWPHAADGPGFFRVSGLRVRPAKGGMCRDQHVFDELKRSEKRLQGIVDTIPSFVWRAAPDIAAGLSDSEPGRGSPDGNSAVQAPHTLILISKRERSPACAGRAPRSTPARQRSRNGCLAPASKSWGGL